jgi:hypothetical protein
LVLLMLSPEKLMPDLHHLQALPDQTRHGLIL